MNEPADTRGSSNAGMTLMGFALGAVVGAGLALLLAPESGRKMRSRLATSARRWTEGAEQTIDQARDSVVELGTDAKSAIKAGHDAFQHDRATRESRSDRRSSHDDHAAPGSEAARHTSEGTAR